MFLMDVNVLVYAHRKDAANHSAYRQWLESIINGQASFGYSELVLSGFLRIVTHPKVFEIPSALLSAICFTEQIYVLLFRVRDCAYKFKHIFASILLKTILRYG